MLPEREGGARPFRYDLLGELATGGMATVYVGLQQRSNAPPLLVAIKSLRQDLAEDDGFHAMFLDEAALTARIRHPNVVRTLDLVSSDDRLTDLREGVSCAPHTRLLIVMEYVEGVSVAKLLEKGSVRRRTMPLPVTVAAVRDVLLGLHAAHEIVDESGRPLGVVHRDVSPQNILVGVDGVARLLDFGVAKAATHRHVTALGEVKGKLAYMPPEQQLAEAVDRRSDVYAAGVVLWEMITGRRLFVAKSEEELVRQVFERAIEPPSMLSDEPIPPALDRVVLRALAKSPEQRWRTADELARALLSAAPAASPAEVATCVGQLAHEELAHRARHIHELREQHAARTSILTQEERIVLDVLSTGHRRQLAPDPSPLRPPSRETKEALRAQRRDRRRAETRKRVLLLFGSLALGIVVLMIVALILGMRSTGD